MKNTIIIPQVNSDFEVLIPEDYPHDNNGNLTSKSFSNYFLEIVESPVMITIKEIRFDSYFTIVKGFNKSGNILHKGVIFTSGSWEAGIWYFFDKSGKLTKTINYEEPFQFGFIELFSLLKEKDIPLTIGYLDDNKFHTSVNRYISESGLPVWNVEWEITFTLKKNMTINGLTGEIIKIEDVEYSP